MRFAASGALAVVSGCRVGIEHVDEQVTGNDAGGAASLATGGSPVTDGSKSKADDAGGTPGTGSIGGMALRGAHAPGGVSGPGGQATGGVDAPDGAGGARSEGGAAPTGGAQPRGGATGGGEGPARGVGAVAPTGGLASASGGALPEGGAGGASESGGAACTGGSECVCRTFEGHRYYFCATPRTIAEAAARCGVRLAALVTIDTAEENDSAVSQAAATGLFLGGSVFPSSGTDAATEGEWAWGGVVPFWSGGSSGAPVDGAYENWRSDSPHDDTALNCLVVTSTGEWTDAVCGDTPRPYVCESW